MILDRGPQFAAGLMKKLSEMLEIETKLSMAFHLHRWTDREDKSRVRTVFENVH